MRRIRSLSVLALAAFVLIAAPGCNNNAPQLAPIGSRTVNAGSPIEFEILGFDPDEDDLSYAANGLPQGASFDPATRVFSWTPDYAQFGVYEVTFSVSDGEDTDTEAIILSVLKVESDYADEVTEIEDDQAAEAELVGNDVVFPADGNENLNELAPGDIIVSGYGDGFLRRVTGTSTTASDIVIHTEQATVVELYKYAALEKSIDLEGASAEPWINYDFSGIKLVDNPEGLPLTVEIVDGHFIVEPTVDVDLQIGGWPPDIEYFYFAMGGYATFDLRVEAVAGGAVNWSDALTIPLGNLQPFTIPNTPIVVVPHLNLLLEAEAGLQGEARAEAGISANSQVSYGAEYQFGEWTDVKTQDFAVYSFGPDLSADVNAHVAGSATIEVKFLFFDVAGPYLYTGPNLGIRAEVIPDCYLQLDAGVSGSFGVELGILWPNPPFDLEWELFNLQQTLYYQECQ